MKLTDVGCDQYLWVEPETDIGEEVVRSLLQRFISDEGFEIRPTYIPGYCIASKDARIKFKIVALVQRDGERRLWEGTPFSSHKILYGYSEFGDFRTHRKFIVVDPSLSTLSGAFITQVLDDFPWAVIEKKDIPVVPK